VTEEETVVQSVFREDGRMVTVLAKDTERPQLEKQGNLLLWAEERERLEQWRS